MLPVFGISCLCGFLVHTKLNLIFYLESIWFFVQQKDLEGQRKFFNSWHSQQDTLTCWTWLQLKSLGHVTYSQQKVDFLPCQPPRISICRVQRSRSGESPFSFLLHLNWQEKILVEPTSLGLVIKLIKLSLVKFGRVHFFPEIVICHMHFVHIKGKDCC